MTMTITSSRATTATQPAAAAPTVTPRLPSPESAGEGSTCGSGCRQTISHHHHHEETPDYVCKGSYVNAMPSHAVKSL